VLGVVHTPTFDLDRFKRAQEQHGSFVDAMSELRTGRKTSHWVWWVFPQIAGLGTSGTSVRFALSGRDETCAYLADDLLRSRLVEAVTAVHEQLVGQPRRRIDALMGSEVDVLKLVSSMTLFAEVALESAVRELPGIDGLRRAAVEILGVARSAGYPACDRTLSALRASATCRG
jgi:uncharacterized protein (DUF1810 family)